MARTWCLTGKSSAHPACGMVCRYVLFTTEPLTATCWGSPSDLTVHVFHDRLEAPEEDPTRIVTRFNGQDLRVPDREEARPDPELMAHRWEEAWEM